MGADRSRIRLAVGLCTTSLLIAALCSTLASAQATSASTPKTAFQCDKKFKPGSQRTACIKRVASEKPGSSCKYPLHSGQAFDGSTSQNSDTKDFTVKVRIDSETSPGEPSAGNTKVLTLEATVHNPRIEICRAVIFSYPPPTISQHVSEQSVKISPHGGAASPLTIPEYDAFAGIVYARLRSTSASSAETGLRVAQAAQTPCKPISRHEPCLAPIQSFYAYAGEGSGDTTYIKAKAGKRKVAGEVYEETPRPGLWQVTKRTFTWHSVAGVRIVAVFVVHGGFTQPLTYQRVRSGPHSGRVTLTAVFDQIA